MLKPLERIVVCAALVAPQLAHADEIPIVTLTDTGPNQDIPTHRSFYVAGDAARTVQNAQAIVVRKGSPMMLGDDGPDCHTMLAALRIDLTSSSAADDEDDELVDPINPARFDPGIHRAFEVFPDAERAARNASVLVTVPWRRSSEDTREYKVLVPHDGVFFSTGYSYCMVVVTTERLQQIDDQTLSELVDRISRKLVACGDKSSCDEDALGDYELAAAREVTWPRSVRGGAKAIAGRLKEAARSELATTTGIVEARDHLHDRWRAKTAVMTPIAPVVWADTSTDPFAHAAATMLARAAALLPQVRDRGVALYTPDGKLEVRAIQILDDGRSIRVATSKAPRGDQARVLTATTDTLVVADNLTLFDLIELGQSRIRVDSDWISIGALGDRVSMLGLDTWTADDAMYLAAATAQMKRLADFVDLVTTGVSCGAHLTSAEIEQTADAVRKHLGEWLVCQHVDAGALEALTHQLQELATEDQAWKLTKDKLIAHSKRIVTVTTTSPLETRVAFSAKAWPFSYITPFAGYAGILRPDESFGLFYFGAQIHFAPNPIDDVLWHGGITTEDLRRSVALEIAVAPHTSSFGPEQRYNGVGGFAPVFVGLALHIVPYTSLTFGGALLDRKLTTLPQEQPHTIFSPYIGFTIQLNVPDMIRQAAHPSTDTTAIR